MNNTELITEWVSNLDANCYDYIEVERELKINRRISNRETSKISLSEALVLLTKHQDDNIRECVLGDIEIHGVNNRKQYYVITLHPVVKRINEADNKALQNSTEKYPIRVSSKFK